MTGFFYARSAAAVLAGVLTMGGALSGAPATQPTGGPERFTALAVSLGAPFWFDMLNKIITVRSTIKPKESQA